MVKDKFKIFEAFSGYGTPCFALKQLGIDFECVGISEIDKYAYQCFIQNHKGYNYGDISKIDWNEVPDFDLLTGGFPCQDVSVAGKQDLNKGRTILGMELTKALKIKQPKYFLFENVKGLMSKKFDDFRNLLIKSWEDAGYKVYYEVLNTKDYGIPQSRARVFFVGIRKDINQDFKFPKKEELKIFIKDILEESVGSKYLLKEHQVKKLLEGIEKKLHFKNRILQDKEISQTLMSRYYKEPKVVQIDTSGKDYQFQQDRFYNAEGIMCSISNAHPQDKVNIFALRSYPRTNNPKKDKQDGRFQNMEVRDDGCSNSLTGVEKDNMVIMRGRPIYPYKDGKRELKYYEYNKISPTISQNCASGDQKNIVMASFSIANKNRGKKPYNYKNREYQLETNGEVSFTVKSATHEFLVGNKELGIFRRLTPKECFRLQGFLNDEVNLNGLSDTQSYRLAGNGQSVNVVVKILKELKLEECS